MTASSCLSWSATLVAPLLLVAGLTGAMSAPAGESGDHDRAREAVASGQILPLREILARLERERPGRQVLEVELERSGGRWIYELKLLQPGGVMQRLKIDARSGVALPARGRGHDED